MQRPNHPPDSDPRVPDPCAVSESAPPTPVSRISSSTNRLSRREFLTETTAISAGAALGTLLTTDTPASADLLPAGAQQSVASSNEVSTTLQINGKPYPMQIETRMSLLDAIRERAHLTGSKKGCDHGQCGACTVHIDGRRVLSCLTLAVMHEGQNITTIEGLADG
ncbi:MAG: hypothetical protein JWN14_3091, partial [Chthonomonadales bacterium]|nr:hypothetical protein [Chthonomonadales bacterium]